MKTISTSEIADQVQKAIAIISCQVEPSCKTALKNALDIETNPTAKFALQVMNDNFDMARNQNVPVCQDTGMVIVFVEIGKDIFLTGELLQNAIDKAVRQAFIPLRKSVLDPVTRKNTKDNTPAIVYTSFVDGDKIKVEIMLKGFGSENMSKVFMLNPAQGLEEAKKLIVQTVKDSASNPCPPVIVGVGLGGTFEKACLMSKHSLFRQIGSSNPDPTLDNLEKELLGQINQLGIGAQGFGGKTTALGLFIESYPTHISSLPVAINILCHCSRSMSFEMEGHDGK